MQIPVGIVALIVGALLLLFGYRIKKIAMTIIWFILGYYLVSLFVDKLVSAEIWQVILCCVGGLVLAMFSMTIEKLAIFITVTASFSLAIIDAFGASDPAWILPVIAIAVGVVAGVLATWFIKPMIIVATAVSGARLVASNGLAMIGHGAPQYFILVFCVLAIFGAVFQWRSCKHIE